MSTTPSITPSKPFSRKQKARVARELRKKGVSYAEIAAALGISAGYVYELTRDPDGSKSKRRRQARARPCADCGEPTSGHSYTRCAACAGRLRQRWSKETIVAAIQTYAKEFGKVPSVPDFAICDRSRFPTPRTVQVVFGSWSAAIEAAGFTPRTRNSPNKTAVLVEEALLRHGIGLDIFNDVDEDRESRR